MYPKLVLICLGAFAAINARADSAPAPQPLVAATRTPSPTDTNNKVGAPKRMLSPTISVMRVTRQADGTLATDCVQRPNPKLRVLPNGAQP